jgi:nucleoid DNA-binding protein
MTTKKRYEELNDKPIFSIKESQNDFEFIRKNKRTNSISKKQYRQILELYMKKLGYYLITTGDEIQLPSRLGSIKIYKYNTIRIAKELKEVNVKVKKMVDFNRTKVLKERGIDKTVLLDNKATYGYWYKIKWSKFDNANFKYKSLYSFNLLRTLVRSNKNIKHKPPVTLVNFFKEKGWTFYSELPRTIKGKYDK